MVIRTGLRLQGLDLKKKQEVERLVSANTALSTAVRGVQSLPKNGDAFSSSLPE
jgi:hypothetical protein